MDILVACEESQAVTIWLRRLGHRAFSCDLIECSGGHPEWHIRQDVLPLLNGRCSFTTDDGTSHRISGRWDALICFPPCTDLAGSGARWFAEKRADGRQRRAVQFFCAFLSADCDIIVIENPVGIISGEYVRTYFPDLAEKYDLPRRPTQIVQPWQFGHGETKATCLWIYGGPPLQPTQVVDGREQRVWRMPPGPERAKLRSKTYAGIARAIAEQIIGPAELQKGGARCGCGV